MTTLSTYDDIGFALHHLVAAAAPATTRRQASMKIAGIGHFHTDAV
jgi:hypothetical protein